MEEAVKGTVTPVASMFPVEEAKKAAKRVEETMVERQTVLERVREFMADNTSLINLVQKLPDHLHHDIMVPFGKAAFFPGRLIHTNEFLVLLGEGYYAERTSKQAIDILKRRGKALESQEDSLKAVMQDLRAEASFFDATASEAAEGLVEIREEIGEEISTESASESGSPKPDSANFSEVDNKKILTEDEEYTRIMSRLEELEEEELAAESINESAATVNESDEDEQTRTDFDKFLDQNSLDHNLRYSEEHHPRKPPQPSKDEHTTTKELLNKNWFKQNLTNHLNFEGLTQQSLSKGEMSHGKSLPHNSNSAEKALVLPEVKENVQAVPSSRNEVSVQTSKPGSDDSLKAFTGSIVERSQKIQVNPKEQTASLSQSPGSQPSKPVSRFKMQRR